MSEVGKLKSERSRIRRSFSNIGKKIEVLVEKPEKTEADLTELSSLLDLLCIRNSELEGQNNLILAALEVGNASEKELNAEQDKVDEISLNYFKYKTTVDKIMSSPTVDDIQSTSERSNESSRKQKCKYKLPILQLKKFGGDLKDWLPFWSQFSKFDEDEKIDDVDKLGYLTQCMIENSPAKELVDSYPATGDMYTAVVKSLKERFGREDLLTEFYMRELLKLIIQNTNSRDKLSVSVLYDRLQCHLRNLDTLGVSSENCAPILMPLVSSCLPEEILMAWERYWAPDVRRSNPQAKSKDFLDNLLLFLQVEVEGEQKVELARMGFGVTQHRQSAQIKSGNQKKEQNEYNESDVPTAAGLLTTMKPTGNTDCIFCGANHNSQDCITAINMTLEKRRQKVSSSKACFCCLQQNHMANRCRNRPKCIICKKGHFVLMCDKIPPDEYATSPQTIKPAPSLVSKDETLATVVNRCSVLMQTLVVLVRGCNGHTRTARLLIDSASHRSYILSKTASEMGYAPCRQENIQHSLFGGATTGVVNHNIYRLYLSKLDQAYHCNFEVLEQPNICGQISNVIDGPWIEELAAHNVRLSDTGSVADIEILVGADIAAKLWTGKRIPLSCGLVAMETSLGWTLSGKVPNVQIGPTANHETLATIVTNMLNKEATISDLWSLDTLGITDPCGKTSKAEMEAAAQQHFLDTVKITENGRFEVHLPWVENHPVLPDNYQTSLKRLHTTVRKLKVEGHYEAYQRLLDEWLDEEVIEEVVTEDLDRPCHYLPHRHVVKSNSTTPVRPVFDASSRENRHPSLNMCLEKGPNLIEKIPSVLARFRLKRVGVVGDIRRAFLQISLCERDRNFLRFLWLDQNGVLKTYRHRRVVFGVSSSPFLLESCIKFHLDNTLMLCEEGKSDLPISLIKLLSNSYYVDNCLASVDNEAQARTFISVASAVMAERQFELRGWELSGESSPNTTNVLGLLWHKSEDVLSVNFDSVISLNTERVTKKIMLSAAHRIFDPIGLFCGVALIPKLLVQQTWELGLTWEQEVSGDLKKKFLDWYCDVAQLAQIKIPRCVSAGDTSDEHKTVHVFSDACQSSYAAVIFLRVECEGDLSVQLLAAKARVAPTAKASTGMTIPRLELLAASIGARLYSSVIKDYNLTNVKTFFWTDASTVLAWIQRNEPWDIFVMNRIKEIRELAGSCEWRHVPGTQNPADLPSRGCSPKRFLMSRWWEGPSWLRDPPHMWPQSEVPFNEIEINSERRKTVVSSMLCSTEDQGWYYKYFSNFKKLVRMIGWLYRFKKNAKLKKSERIHQDLTASEYADAEHKVICLIQEEAFKGVFDPKLSSLLPFVDSQGIIRLMTKVSNRDDLNDFCHPAVLPSADHPVVHRIIMDIHRSNCHAGTQMSMSILRQQYWILGGRQTVRVVLNSCMRCKRSTAKRAEAEPSPLPETRVRNAKIFEVTGVDLTGPLYIKDDRGEVKKFWVCLFTCGVYRAVHLELVSSLSTDSFLQAFRRFSSRRGRPKIVYSDQGTNFVGADNAFKKVNWDTIAKYSSVRKIEWRFNPPASPWWGGWWERLIGVLKTLLRRVLGRSSVNYEEMITILCDCEAVINSRPLTYVSQDPNDLVVLTPSMFLQDIEEVGAPDFDLIDASDLNKRLRYRHKLKQALRDRFRDEYLGQLRLLAKEDKIYDLSLGDIVLVGGDDTKRIDWPLGRIVELIPGNDGNIRVVRVRTAFGELVRSVQRVYPLELHYKEDDLDQTIADHLRGTVTPDELNTPSTHVEDYHDPPSHGLPSDEAQDERSTASPSDESRTQFTRSGRLIRKPNKMNL